MDYYHYDESDFIEASNRLAAKESGGIFSAFWFNAAPWLFIFFLLNHFWFRIDFLRLFRQWQERQHRKQVRRRHGIPDNDIRPFNVAYTAAVQAREPDFSETSPEEEVDDAGEAIPSNTAIRPTSILAQRRRVVVEDDYPAMPGAGSFASEEWDSHEKPSNPSTTLRPRNSIVSFVDDHQPLAPKSKTSPGSRYSYPSSSHLAEASSPPKRTRPPKHSLDEDDSIIINKKSKAGQVRETSSRRSSGQGLERGSKRQASSDTEEYDSEMEDRYRDKRLRKVSDGSQIEIDEDSVDSEEESDNSMDLDYTSRGMKRDRADVGSTFDSDEDVPVMGKRPRRKSRKSSPILLDSEFPRRKRDRDTDGTPESDDETYRRKYKLLRRKSKRLQKEDTETSTDISLDEIKVEPSCKGRKIGEEWESNGVHWKVGVDGRRLRQAILKKSKGLYNMPADSLHPDAKKQITVYIENWLNDDEFSKAKEDGRLFVPEEENRVANAAPKTPVKKDGKELLWLPATKDSNRRIKETSIVNINPFEHPPANMSTGRRINIPRSPTLNALIRSPQLYPTRTYSKWEKQEMEAQAIAKMRKSVQAKSEAKHVSFALPTAEASAIPITRSFTAPATSGLGAGGQNTPPVVSASASLPTVPEAVPQPLQTPAAQPAPPAPAMTTSDSASAAPPNSGFSFGGKPTRPTSAAPSASGGFTPFGKPSVPTSAAPSFSAFSKPSTPAFAASSIGASAQPAASTTDTRPAPSPFSVPSSSSTQSASNAKTTPAATNPVFSFGGQPNQPAQAVPTESTAPSSGAPSGAAGGSLFTRLGGFAPSPAAGSSFSFGTSPANTTTQPKPAVSEVKKDEAGSATAQPSASTGPKFSFTIPGKTTGSSPLGSSAPAAAAPSTGAFQNASSAPNPGGNFAFGTPSATASTTPFGTPAASSNDAPKPTFAFGAPAGSTTSSTPGSTSTPTAQSTTSSKPLFSFGVTGASTSSTTPAAAPPKSVFGFGATGGSTGGSNESAPAATDTTMPKPMAFGTQGGVAQSTTQSTAPNASFAFGAWGGGSSSTTPAAPKTMFGFGTHGGTNSTTSTTENVAPGSAFGFGHSGGTTASTTPAAENPASKSTFGFGTPSANSPSTTPATENAAPKSTFAFGNPNGTGTSATPAAESTAPKSVFGFGTPSGTSTTPAAFSTPSSNTFAFGGTANPTASTPAPSADTSAAPKPASGFGAFPSTAPKSVFGFGSTGGAKFGETNAFGSSAPKPLLGSSTPSAFPTPSSAGATEPENKPTFSFNFTKPAGTTPNPVFGSSSTISSNPFLKPASTSSFAFGSSSSNTSSPQPSGSDQKS